MSITTYEDRYLLKVKQLAKTRDEVETLRATVAALTSERDAAYRRGWDAARDAAAVCVDGIWNLKSVTGEVYEHVMTDHIAGCVRALDFVPDEHDAAMLEAWHERQ